MVLRAVALVFAAFTPTASLHAQSGNFDIVSDGKVVGHSTYTLAKAKQGFRLQGHLSYVIRSAEARSLGDLRYSDTYTFLQGSISDQNTQTVFSYTPDKPRTTLAVGTMHAGTMDSFALPISTDAIFLPAYDAGAAQVAILLALTHPTAGNAYKVIVPAAGGHSPSTNDPHDRQMQTAVRRASDNAYDVKWAKGPDLAGTLDGKPITVHAYALTGPLRWIFYADDENNLMEVDSSFNEGKCVRVNFKLGGS